jgi:hypothetical protein
MSETAANYCTEDKMMHVSTDDRKWITRLQKAIRKHPGEVVVIRQPEVNGGYLTVDVPKSWLKIVPPTKRDLTDEQRAVLADRMRKVQSK